MEIMGVFVQTADMSFVFNSLYFKWLKRLYTEVCLRELAKVVSIIHAVSVVCIEPLNQFL